MNDMKILLEAYQVLGRIKIASDLPVERALAAVSAYNELGKFIMPDYAMNKSGDENG